MMVMIIIVEICLSFKRDFGKVYYKLWRRYYILSYATNTWAYVFTNEWVLPAQWEQQIKLVRSKQMLPGPSPENPLKGVSFESFSMKDGIIRCSFTRVVSLEDDDDNDGDDDEFFDLSPGNTYNILLAWDGSLSGDGNILRHRSDGRIASDQKVDLTDISGSGSGKSLSTALKKTHGSLMVISWLCLVSIGITTARYFKDLPGKFCGKPTWFSVHRLCMASAVVLFLVAFILIIIAVPGFYKLTGDGNGVRAFHSLFGILVILLGIINVIMALFRPHPGEPRRNLYNWAHWGVGTSSHLIALITIFLGTANFPNQTAIPLLDTIPSFVFIIVVLFLVFHVILWIVFTFVKAAENSKESSSLSNEIALKNGEESQPDQPPPEKKISTFMLVLYMVYVSVAGVLTLIIVVSVSA